MFNNFCNIFLSIILQGLPFIIFGAFLSSIISLYLNEDTIKKLLPKNKFLSYVAAAFVGLFFPICECSIVPIIKKLINKGLPLSVGITIMLSAPVINPVVILSTYYAFHPKVNILIIRIASVMVISIICGILIELIFKNNSEAVSKNDKIINYSTCSCGQTHSYLKEEKSLHKILSHTSKEFYNIFKLYIIGSFLTSIFQVFLNVNKFSMLNRNITTSIVIMMIIAFLLSICSEGDAFIAKGFLPQFGVYGVTAFLILGPMLDLKNLIMLSGYFKKNFVFVLSFLIISLSFIASCIVGILGF